MPLEQDGPLSTECRCGVWPSTSRGGRTASGSFPAATDLGFTGFFFPLLKSILEMSSDPAAWLPGRLCRWAQSPEGGATRP